MDHTVIFVLLDDSVHRHQPRAHDDLALLLEHVGPDDEFCDAVSSSRVMNTTPFALPGRWRISTSPAIDRRCRREWLLAGPR